jgi:hypothetical protein
MWAQIEHDVACGRAPLFDGIWSSFVFDLGQEVLWEIETGTMRRLSPEESIKPLLTLYCYNKPESFFFLQHIPVPFRTVSFTPNQSTPPCTLRVSSMWGVFATMDSWPKGFWDSFEDICFFTYLDTNSSTESTKRLGHCSSGSKPSLAQSRTARGLKLLQTSDLSKKGTKCREPRNAGRRRHESQACSVYEE